MEDDDGAAGKPLEAQVIEARCQLDLLSLQHGSRDLQGPGLGGQRLGALDFQLPGHQHVLSHQLSRPWTQYGFTAIL